MEKEIITQNKNKMYFYLINSNPNASNSKADEMLWHKENRL